MLRQEDGAAPVPWGHILPSTETPWEACSKGWAPGQRDNRALAMPQGQSIPIPFPGWSSPISGGHQLQHQTAGTCEFPRQPCGRQALPCRRQGQEAPARPPRTLDPGGIRRRRGRGRDFSCFPAQGKIFEPPSSGSQHPLATRSEHREGAGFPRHVQKPTLQRRGESPVADIGLRSGPSLVEGGRGVRGLPAGAGACQELCKGQQPLSWLSRPGALGSLPHGVSQHWGLHAGPEPLTGGTLATAANMSDFWHKLGCCVVEKPQPKRRRRIDRSMIGEPMNFVHLTHIGSSDMAAGEGLPMTGAVQEMRSKGGRERQWSSSRVL
nr:PREDICTED: CDC42 small effector protein 1 isoform X2 [Struthio camelus australis]